MRMVLINNNVRGCNLTSFIIKGRDKTEHSVAQTQNKHNITYSEGTKRKTKWSSTRVHILGFTYLPCLEWLLGVRRQQTFQEWNYISIKICWDHKLF